MHHVGVAIECGSRQEVGTEMAIDDDEFSAWMLQAIAVDGIARIGNNEFFVRERDRR